MPMGAALPLNRDQSRVFQIVCPPCLTRAEFDRAIEWMQLQIIIDGAPVNDAITDAELLEQVRILSESGEIVSVNMVRRRFHVGDKRAIKAVSMLRAKPADVSASENQCRAKVQLLQQDIEAAKDDLESMRRERDSVELRAKELSSSCASLQGLVAKHLETIAALEREIEDHKTHNAGLRRDLSRLERGVDGKSQSSESKPADVKQGQNGQSAAVKQLPTDERFTEVQRKEIQEKALQVQNRSARSPGQRVFSGEFNSIPPRMALALTSYLSAALPEVAIKVDDIGDRLRLEM